MSDTLTHVIRDRSLAGISGRGIAKELEISHWTVRKALSDAPLRQSQYDEKRSDYFKRKRRESPEKFRLKDRQQYQKHREKILNNSRERAQRNKQAWLKIIAEKGMNKCSVCGYDRCFEAIDFHHKEPATKKFEIGMILQSKVNSVRLEELDKCVALCRNCHAELHAKEK